MDTPLNPNLNPASDPRDVVTPNAFRLEPELLGLALATPGRRLAAIAVDTLVIGMLTAASGGFGTLIWSAVGAFLVFMAFRRPRPDGSKRGPLFRGAVGCLGIVILGLVSLVFVISNADLSDVAPDAETLQELQSLEAPGELQTALQMLGGGAAFAAAEDSADARIVAELTLAAARTSGVDEAEWREFLRSVMSEDAPWAGDFDVIVARALGAEPTPAAATTAPDLSLPALDSIAALQAEITRLAERQGAIRRERDELQDRLAQGDTTLTGLLSRIWDELGSALGLWTLYFTIALTLSQGRTLGKKLFGMRVVRLDGQPLGWWAAFERSGGYAAGIATGLLGFVQIFWDANRQCIQDKIGGTVVLDTRTTAP
jgi:hypothetical protein